ncbi:eotaxin-like [Halichoeres trimaculatus]|uniref:eotaxin-like n=1 Tax=Halichoeres trimaculatus TaxID=147232 RepID=UPI003D9E505F
MAPRSLIAVTAVLLCITLGLVNPASATRPRKVPACCTSFTKGPIPFDRIRGYREISGDENCRMKAIVFIMKLRKEICVRPGDKWVMDALKYLSEKLKEKSKSAADADKSHSKTSVSTVVNDGSGFYSSTTDGYYW